MNSVKSHYAALDDFRLMGINLARFSYVVYVVVGGVVLSFQPLFLIDVRGLRLLISSSCIELPPMGVFGPTLD